MAETLDVVITLDDKASPKAKQVGQDLSTGLKQLGGVAMIGLTAGAAVAGAALVGVGAGLKIAIDEAMEAQDILAQLDAVLKATGGSAGLSSDELVKMATGLSQVTKYSEETILSAETMLLQFKNIGQDAFPQATETALDLATRLGIDVTSAAKLLGKALETPGEGLLRLKQAGVAFTDEQTDMVKAMVEAGNAAGAQKFIMDALAASVGGAAVAAGSTMSGQMTIMKNMMSETFEDLGTAILPALTEAFAQIRPVIMDLANQFSEFVKSDQFKKWIQDIINWLKNDLPVAIEKVSTFWKTQLQPALQQIGSVLSTEIIPVLKTVLEVIGPPLLKALSLLWEGFKINVEITTKLWDAIGKVIEGWKKFFDWINKIKDSLGSLTLPAWLTPGSPTPLELGIRGINDALGGMAGGGLPGLTNNFNQMSAPAMAGAGYSGGITVVYSPGMSLGNQSEFESQFIPMLQRALQKVNRGKV
jgi:hypothetical protein